MGLVTPLPDRTPSVPYSKGHSSHQSQTDPGQDTVFMWGLKAAWPTAPRATNKAARKDAYQDQRCGAHPAHGRRRGASPKAALHHEGWAAPTPTLFRSLRETRTPGLARCTTRERHNASQRRDKARRFDKA